MTTLETLLSDSTLTGRKTVSAMQKDFSADATYAGVNGDFSNFKTGLPSGGLVQQGQILAEPNGARSTLGITADGTLDVRRVATFGTWKGTGAAHVLNGVNQVPAVNGISLFTSAWGPATPDL